MGRQLLTIALFKPFKNSRLRRKAPRRGGVWEHGRRLNLATTGAFCPMGISVNLLATQHVAVRTKRRGGGVDSNLVFLDF